MPAKIIVSYDGTANEDDAIALGRLLARAGAQVALAYVRHAREADSESETRTESGAHELLLRGAELYRDQSVATHVITDRSTPEGLRRLAEQEGANVIVFCSDSHTARGHVAVGNSAQRLLEGGRTAIAIAPAGLAQIADARLARVVAIGDADGGAARTAETIAGAFGGSVEPVVSDGTELLVVDSRPEAARGETAVSASAFHLIEGARSSVLVIPRGVVLPFEPSSAAAAA
ncbi:MAG TPA: universal stress protein [Solirubrobacteraceae bacterium]|jgi:nucleotide-binding universal stress UspA family protein|nr:universal stress protein [Solirubrobacteraceae bacterium]